MDQNQCLNCGGALREVGDRLVCESCGTYVPRQISNEETMLLTSACQKLRLAQFSEAELEFDDIVKRHPKCSQAYWGRLLAKYGIKYEMDYNRSVPTCYAASIESVFDSSDYQKAIDYADKENRKVFKEHAEYIERVRLKWLEKASKEQPYDIFISYKDSETDDAQDSTGSKRTQDSYDAQELYYHLKDEGYRVFFSRESLVDNAGEKYEPYIYGALSTAKVMIVYGSKPEYINATWVKNEWTRYLKRMEMGEKEQGSLIVAYKGFSPKELPSVLSSLQCLDMKDPYFYTTLLGNINRIVKEHKPEETSVSVDLQNASDLDIMRARRKNGEHVIAQVGFKGTSDPDDYWPTTPYTQVLSVDEYSYVRFHCVFMKAVGVQATKKLGYQVFDSHGSLVHERETEIAFEPSYDRCSLFWRINSPDSIPASPGKYTLLIWVDDSRAFEQTFRLTSASGEFEKQEEEKERKLEAEDIRNNVEKQIEAKKEIAEIKRKLSYPKLALWGLIHFVISYVMFIVLVGLGGFSTGASAILTVASVIVYAVIFFIVYKKTRAVTLQGPVASFLLVLSSLFYVYPAYLCVMALITFIRKRALTKRLSELEQMLGE